MWTLKEYLVPIPGKEVYEFIFSKVVLVFNSIINKSSIFYIISFMQVIYNSKTFNIEHKDIPSNKYLHSGSLYLYSLKCYWNSFSDSLFRCVEEKTECVYSFVLMIPYSRSKNLAFYSFLNSISIKKWELANNFRAVLIWGSFLYNTPKNTCLSHSSKEFWGTNQFLSGRRSYWKCLKMITA